MDTANTNMSANMSATVDKATMNQLATELRNAGNGKMADALCNANSNARQALHDQAIAWLSGDERRNAERKMHVRTTHDAHAMPTATVGVTVRFTYGGRTMTEVYDLDRACQICSVAASGMYMSAIQRTLRAHHDVALELKRRADFASECRTLSARLITLSALSCRHIDAMWGAKAKRAHNALELAINRDAYRDMRTAHDQGLRVMAMAASGFAKRTYAAINTVLSRLMAKGHSMTESLSVRAMRHVKHLMAKRYGRRQHKVPTWLEPNDAMSCSIISPSTNDNKRAMRWRPIRLTDAFIMPMATPRPPVMPTTLRLISHTATPYALIPDACTLHDSAMRTSAAEKRNAIKHHITIWHQSHIAAASLITDMGGYADSAGMTYHLTSAPLYIAPLLALCSCGKPALLHQPHTGRYFCSTCLQTIR